MGHTNESMYWKSTTLSCCMCWSPLNPSAPRWMKLWQSCRLIMPRKKLPRRWALLLLLPLRQEKKSRKPNNPSLLRPQLRSEDVLVCLWTSTPRTKLQIQQVILYQKVNYEAPIIFSIIRIYSLGSVVTQTITFFFFIVDSGFFSPHPRNWF